MYAWPCPPRLIVSTYGKVWWWSGCKKVSVIPFFFFWDIAKILQTFHSGYFRHALLWPVKAILSAYRKSCLSPTSFLKYYKDLVNLLFWVLWVCLATSTENNSSNLWDNLMFICKLQINLTTQFFLEILHFKESCNLIGQKPGG